MNTNEKIGRLMFCEICGQPLEEKDWLLNSHEECVPHENEMEQYADV